MPAAAPSTKNTIRKTGRVWKPKWPNSQSIPHPSPPPTTSAATSSVAKRPAMPACDGGGRFAAAACRFGLHRPACPDPVQPVGVWSRQNRLPKCSKNQLEMGLPTRRRRADHRVGPFWVSRKTDTSQQLILMRKMRALCRARSPKPRIQGLRRDRPSASLRRGSFPPSARRPTPAG